MWAVMRIPASVVVVPRRLANRTAYPSNFENVPLAGRFFMRHPRTMTERTIESPVGVLRIMEMEGAITRLAWGQGAMDETPLLLEAEVQLRAYFAQEREAFDLPLHVEGSPFQRAVCDAMRAIPFGYTRTYGEIAQDLSVGAQAVGRACGANPIPVLIPCHRVMGAKGLTGFSGGGGVETKVALLRLEGAAGLLL